MRLSERQKRFVDEYLVDLNATRAYRAVYPDCASDHSASVCGSRSLKNPAVRAYLEQRQADLRRRVEVRQADIITELAAIAFAVQTDYMQLVTEPGDNGRPRQKLVCTPTQALTERQRKAVACIKEGRYGMEIQTCDKVKALELLGRHLGMFKGDDAGQPKGQVVIVGADSVAE